jgi:hypothetical protein
MRKFPGNISFFQFSARTSQPNFFPLDMEGYTATVTQTIKYCEGVVYEPADGGYCLILYLIYILINLDVNCRDKLLYFTVLQQIFIF